MTAMLATFYFWIRSIRVNWVSGLIIGSVAGLAYGYMVAAWGGYVFVINMVALHCASTFLFQTAKNQYSHTLHAAYSTFYLLGTSIAVQVPPVGWAPVKSLEQIIPLLLFLFLQVMAVAEFLRQKEGVPVRSRENFNLRIRVCGVLLAALFVISIPLNYTGFFGPISSRVRALFVTHTRTGNPLVDSVAEHQPATAEAYTHYLHFCKYFLMPGPYLLPFLEHKRPEAVLFLFLYALIAYFFSLKMARLMIITGPVAAALGGMLLGRLLSWCLDQLSWSDADSEEAQEAAQQLEALEGKGPARQKGKKGSVAPRAEGLDGFKESFRLRYTAAQSLRRGVAVVFIAIALSGRVWSGFQEHSERMAMSFSNPQIMFKSNIQGVPTIIDDYREAYFWLRDNTPEDSRVMSWWDYGYQITGIANRTTIADGNTWNHEHIATLGYCLTSPVPRAHELIRHVSDYVLVWSGGHGDDLAKSPHMARIGNSVYRDICDRQDPLCTKFGFKDGDQDRPTKMMKDSLLYNLHQHGRKGVYVDGKYFTEAYTSKYGLIRIFKVTNVDEESKKLLASPANRDCDAPGSWYCVGRYPTAKPWMDLLAKRRNFGQLEDFNQGNVDEEYQAAYEKQMRERGG
eukprot:NODE_300_length_2280_cov_21.496190_g232_i0.p1 GENE.NODE_300_length_2280_cov_21.496190_g232_i0~~NODE_300_length_2280_cov_21.496190_g232_i0.p1  ORF type:complete len:703 (-),score=210.36 NODE_300_length_2280_cov_21.496190_g232_i0:171-2048(-)